ncbi:MAG: DUF4167 domain-containing protein [Candidatus Puniceispirillaceae bacterium]
MRHNQGQNSKRARGRGRRNGGHNQVNFNRNTTFDSNGPEGRLRGNAQQLFEKYTALAYDANAAGERISAEAFTQYADHYYRIHQSILQNAEQQRKAHDERQQSRRRDQNGSVENGSGENNSGENTRAEAVPTEDTAPDKASADGQDKASGKSGDLSDEEATAGVKKMVAAGRTREPRTSKKTQEAAATDSPEGDDATEAVA